MKTCIILLLFAQSLAAQTLPVVLQRTLRPDVKGKILITEKGLVFSDADGKNGHEWAYQDIQSFDRRSKTEFVILSYEDQRWQLGRDRAYHFKVTAGEVPDELFDILRHRLNKAVTNRVVALVQNPDYMLPVKHLHTFGGCEGELIFTPDVIYYSTSNKEDSREWRLIEEVESIWSADPYSLEVHVYENNQRGFAQTRVFKFALKQRLDSDFYRKFKLKLYSLSFSNSQAP